MRTNQIMVGVEYKFRVKYPATARSKLAHNHYVPPYTGRKP